ncbi:MAG: pur operon repressor [Clostridia bacterium]|nr:pur operon repressor [Clostridia bacterium]
MEKYRRNERMSVTLKLLSDEPNRLFTLSHFCELFGTAKSSMSEDLDILRKLVSSFDLGEIETITGASGGIIYRPRISMTESLSYIEKLSRSLSGTSRVLPGGFLYTSDILADPIATQKMGRILASAYYDTFPDFVLTMETKGIPVALTTAHALGVPLVIARHTSKAYEGSAVNINYVSGSSGSIQTMSLARRAVQAGQQCLIVDDFLKGGGTAKGMVDLMKEFDVKVVGSAFVIETEVPAQKRVTNVRSLMTLAIDDNIEGEEGDLGYAVVRPSKWLKEAGL